jgi:L-asparaginase
MNLDTFRAPEFGPLGTVDEDRVAWSTRPAGRSPTHDIDRERLTNDVRAVTVTADMPEETLRGATDAAAVCLATTGAGHVPPGILPALGALADAGVPLVATTRCPEGRLARHTYDFPGSEASLRELGCYFADRNLQKTRIETVVALAADALEGTFDRPA